MKTLKGFLPLIALTLMMDAHAGDKGHGGGGHACGDKVELYDFFEGRSPMLHGIKLWETDPALSVEDYIQKAMDHLKKDAPAIGQYIESKVNALLGVPYDDLVLPILIPRTLDADLPLIEEGCEFKQVASWNERFGKVFFSRSIFEKMDNKSKAGLYFHEAMYKIARDFGLENSDGVRIMVAKIFSDVKLSSEALERHVLPQGEVAFIPKKGMCELSIETSSKYLENVAFNVSFSVDSDKRESAYSYKHQTGFFHKKWEIVNEKISVPCEQILEKGLRGRYNFSYFKPRWDFEVSFKVNGKKIRRDILQNLKELADLGIPEEQGLFWVKPERMFAVE